MNVKPIPRPEGPARHRWAIALFCLLFPVAVLAQSQKFTGTFKEAKLQTVLSAIQSKTKVKFIYNTGTLNNKQRITATANNEEVNTFLSRVLKPLRLEVVWSQGVGVIRRTDRQQAIRIVGTVRDAYGETLTGASIIVAGSASGTTSNANGKFTLHVRANDVLQVSYIGYDTQNISVDNRTTINITLREHVSEIAEYVHTGYQNVERSKLTSAVTSIKMDDIRVDGINTIDGMLEGRVPGMIFMKNSGQTGAAPKLRIRGTSTVIGNREPLWVLDGIVLNDPVNVDTEQLNDPDFVNLLGNAIAGLNPNDIEQIDVLKHASATAL